MDGPFPLLEGYPDVDTVPDGEMIKKLDASMTGIHMVLITGWWCPECTEMIPRLRSIMNRLTVNVLVEIVEMVPGIKPKKATELDVQAIPTIVLFRNGEELGRIIEEPEKTLVEDLLRISGGS